MNKLNSPIGVFDSGLGGLTVVKELMKKLPYEDIVYFGDTARVPYGTKSRNSIIRFSRDNAKVLLKKKVKMIVVACNSSSSCSLNMLRKEFHVPVVGVIEPGAKDAVAKTKNGKVGVIATSATINSDAYKKNILKIKRNLQVSSKECSLFVPLVEEGWLDSPITLSVVKEYLTSLKKKNVDTLILGCTHYPLLKKSIAKVMGKRVVLIDSAEVIAKEVKEILIKNDLRRTKKRKAKYTFMVSDKPQQFQRIAKKFLGRDVSKGVVHV